MEHRTPLPMKCEGTVRGGIPQTNLLGIPDISLSKARSDRVNLQPATWSLTDSYGHPWILWVMVQAKDRRDPSLFIAEDVVESGAGGASGELC